MKNPRAIENLIATFRGFPTDDSLSKKRNTKSLDSLIENCVNRYKIGQQTQEEIILSHWARIVGPRFAQRCAPEKVDHTGILLINVNNAVLRRELRFMEDRILTALRSIDGCENIQGIAFKAG